MPESKEQGDNCSGVIAVDTMPASARSSSQSVPEQVSGPLHNCTQGLCTSYGAIDKETRRFL